MQCFFFMKAAAYLQFSSYRFNKRHMFCILKTQLILWLRKTSLVPYLPQNSKILQDYIISPEIQKRTFPMIRTFELTALFFYSHVQACSFSSLKLSILKEQGRKETFTGCLGNSLLREIPVFSSKCKRVSSYLHLHCFKKNAFTIYTSFFLK